MINNHGYEHQGNPWTLIPAQSSGVFTLPRVLGGIVRLINFLSLSSKNLSLTNKYICNENFCCW
jgi:hypothetical protein